MKKHLAIKIFLVTLLLLLVLSGVIYGVMAIGMSYSYMAELNESLNKQIEDMLPALQEISDDEMDNTLQLFAVEHGLSMEWRDSKGNVLKSYGMIEYDLAPGVDPIEMQNSKGVAKSYFVEDTNGQVYQLLVFGSKQQANVILNSLKRFLPILLIATIFITLSISVFYARYVSKPIIMLSRFSRKMAHLDFTEICPQNRYDEIGVLGEDLNYLSGRLQETLHELKEKNEWLQKDIEREQDLERQQLSFFSAVSHELKTPITILKGQIQGMIYQVGGYKDRDKYLRRAGKVVDMMEEMIQEILSVAQIKSMGCVLNRIPQHLEEIVRCNVESMEDIVIEKGIQLHLKLDEHMIVQVDRKLFEKVVSNLIGNAIKYSPENGNVWIEVYKNEKVICFSVENESDPIPEEEIVHLFEAFYRCDKSRNRSAGGSGLGLYIVKMIVELHGYICCMKNTERGIKTIIKCIE